MRCSFCGVGLTQDSLPLQKGLSSVALFMEISEILNWKSDNCQHPSPARTSVLLLHRGGGGRSRVSLEVRAFMHVTSTEGQVLCLVPETPRDIALEDLVAYGEGRPESKQFRWS